MAELYGNTVQDLIGSSTQGYTNLSDYRDNAFSAYVVYQESQKQYERIIESQKETVAAQGKTIMADKDSIETLKALVASLQAQLAELKNKS